MEVGMGLYTDVGLANLPQTIAMIGGSFVESDGGILGHRSKRSRMNTSSSSSGGETSSADEKKMMERERNRRQARKSRTLKKQCTDKMQEQLTQLHKEAEEVEARNREAAQKLASCRDDRRRTLRTVFDLRAAGSVDEEAWEELVSDDLRLTMPITPYRSFSPADVVNNRRVLLGIDGMLSDVQSLAVNCDSIGVKTRRNEGPVSIVYTLGCDDDSGGNDGAFFNNDGLMCSFKMRTVDAIAHGACSECEKSGMVRARFNSENKIEELDITFDPVAYYQQLMRAAGKNDFPVVPNTLQNALRDKKSRIVVTTARHPFRITHVNSAWTELCGFNLEECEGKSLSILQGVETDMGKVAGLCDMNDKGFAASMVVTNHNKKGERFRNHLRCYPVFDEDPDQISHIVGHLDPIPSQNDEQHNMAMSAVPAF